MNRKKVTDFIQFSDEKLKKNNLFETDNFFCDVYCLKPGQKQKAHTHAQEDKIYYVLKGNGLAQLGEEEFAVKEGDCLLAEKGELHGVRNEDCNEFILLVFMTPNPNRKESN